MTNSYPLRWLAVHYLVDSAGGEWNGVLNRDLLGFFPMDYRTGKEIYPPYYDPSDWYLLDNMLYGINLSFLGFQALMVY